MALYFCCENGDQENSQVVVMEVPKNSAKFFSSDSVSCKSNLVNFSDDEKESIRTETRTALLEIFGGNPRQGLLALRDKQPEKWSDCIKKFNEMLTVARLVQFVREEKPYFQPKIDPIDLYRAEAVLPKRSNPRIAAQSGAFIVFGLNAEYDPQRTQHISVSRIDISAAAKPGIITALDAIGVHENSVYPELHRAASRISKKFKTDDEIKIDIFS